MEGRDWVGTEAGRATLRDVLQALGLHAPTASQPHRETEQRAIDHVAVPRDWTVSGVEHVVAVVDGRHLSDHDAYVVETEPDAAG